MPASPNSQTAEALAIQALGFVAADPVLLPRFLALTGIEASEIRRAAAEPGFLAGVLNFLLAHDINPAAVGQAQRALPGGGDDFLAST